MRNLNYQYSLGSNLIDNHNLKHIILGINKFQAQNFRHYAKTTTSNLR